MLCDNSSILKLDFFLSSIVNIFIRIWIMISWQGINTLLLFLSFKAFPIKHSISNSIQFSCSVMSDSLQPHESQHARPPCSSPTPGVYSNSGSLSWGCYPAISSSVSPSPPAPNPSQHQGLFQWVNSLHEVAKELEFQLQHQSFQWTPRTDLL